MAQFCQLLNTNMRNTSNFRTYNDKMVTELFWTHNPCLNHSRKGDKFEVCQTKKYHPNELKNATLFYTVANLVTPSQGI